jgi:uncharacterized repeat protein (TIGR01451 family)
VSGNVYRDFNSNGTKDTSGINNAIDSGVSGVLVTAYDATGAQVGIATTNATGDYILTIANASTSDVRIEFGTLPAGYESSFHGGTSVQFAQLGATNVNFAIHKPSDYCQNNPFICGNYYRAGDVDGVTLVAFPYGYSADKDGNINGIGPTPYNPPRPDPTALALNSQVGTTYGIAWHKPTKSVFVGAYIKRKAKLGALSGESTGAIYRVSPTNAFAPSVYVDLNVVFPGAAGANPHPTVTTNWFDDAPTVPLIGKRGLGDLDLSQDGNTIYAVNLNDRRLYAIPTTGALNASTIFSYPIPTAGLPTPGGTASTCAQDDVRPFGVGVDGSGTVYVGGVCSAESTANRNNLRGYVWRFSGGTFTLVVNMSLTFFRMAGNWEYWANVDNVLSRAAPMLTDIAFDGPAMILGYRDRYGDQTPLKDRTPVDSPYPRSYGDTVRVCSDAGGNWVVESNGACGGISTGGVNNFSGPDGGEYYYEEFIGDPSDPESGQGSLIQIPGYPDVLSTAYDAVAVDSNGTRITNNVNTAGVQRYNNITGQYTGAYDVYTAYDLNTFGKTAGIGDIEALCDEAPIELGNRVWFDRDRDGIQDAGEPGLAGVTVELRDGANTVISTTTTAADGTYYFASTNTGPLQPNTTYTVGIPSGQAALSNYLLTTRDASANTNDTRDSDGTLVATNGATFSVTTGNAGQNNHTVDFGYWLPASLGNYVWVDANRDGQQNDGPTGVSGVTVTLYDAGGLPIGTTQTDSTGYYSFTNLLPGTYSVGFTAPVGYTFTVQGATTSSDTDSNADPVTGRTSPVTLGAGQNNPTIDAGLVVLQPAISLRKFTNGQDADTPPGVYVQPGSTVTWTYVVKNIGQTPLDNLTLTDDIEGAITCPQTSLAVGEEITCTKVGIAMLGQYANTGNVTGTNVFNPQQQVTSTNPSHYYGSTAGIVLKKYTNGYDADALPLVCNADGGQACLSPGSTVTWTYVVTNTGNVVLNNVALIDDVEGAITCPQNTLQPGASMLCTRTGIAESGQYTNTGTVTAIDATNPNGPGLTSSDPSHYFGATPGIVLKKYTNGHDADTPTGPNILVGQPVTWTYVVTNTGNITLVNVQVTDDIEGVISCPKTTLLPGEVMTCEKAGVARAGQYANTGTVSAVNSATPNGPGLTSSDPSHYFGATPGIVLKKYVNGDDANTAPGITVPVGSTVTWTYIVTNTGNTVLNNVAVVDDIEGAIPCPKNTLQPGESMTCTRNGVVTLGQYRNVGTVTATDLLNPDTPLTSSDPAHHNGGAPDIRIRKLSNPGNGVFVRVGDTVSYTIVISNVGAMTATNVVVRDPIPAGTTYVDGSANPTPESVGNEIVWRFPEIGPNGVLVFSFYVVRIETQTQITAIRNVATVQTDQNPAPITSNEVINPLGTTAVTLASFTARLNAPGSGVTIAWRTSVENNTWGFTVLRSATGNVADAVVAGNGEFIPATGMGGAGGRYTLNDPAGSVNATYWLREVETDGDIQVYGPIPVSTEGVIGSGIPAQVPQAHLPIQANLTTANGGVPIAVSANDGVVAPTQSTQHVQPTHPDVIAAQPVALTQAQSTAPAQQQSRESQADVSVTRDTAVASSKSSTDVTIAEVSVEAAQDVPTGTSAQTLVGSASAVNVVRGGVPAQHTAHQAAAVQPKRDEPAMPLSAVIASLLGVAAGSLMFWPIARRKRT